MITYSEGTTSPFAFGTTATYSCYAGFYLAGTLFRTCIGSGSQSVGFWLGTEPECLGKQSELVVTSPCMWIFFTAITCTTPTVPLNGFVSYGPDTTSPYDYQTTATYSCNEGYGLSSGDSSRQCENSAPGDGGWSGNAPTCDGEPLFSYVILSRDYNCQLVLVIVCPFLPSPADGVVAYTTASPFTYGAMATYSCNGGFGLSGGDVTRVCGGDGSSVNGMWSGVAPICEGTLQLYLLV